jgi:CHAT domain-containing protein
VARAERLLRDAVRIADDALLPEWDPPSVAARDSLALLLAQQRGDPAAGLAFSERNVAAMRAAPRPDPAQIACVLNNNSVVRQLLGDLGGARAALEEIGPFEAALPAEERAQLRINRSGSERAAARPRAALALADAAVALLEDSKVSERDRRFRRALAQRMRFNALHELGRRTEAEAAAREDAATTRALGIGGIDLAVAVNNHGLSLWRIGRLEEAEQMLLEARAAVPRHVLRGVIDDHLAQIALARSDCAAAAAHIARAEAVLAVGGADPMHRALVHRSRGWAARFCGDMIAAERELGQATALLAELRWTGGDPTADVLAGQLRSLGGVFDQYLLVLAQLTPDGTPGPERATRIFEAVQLGRGGGAQLALARAARRTAADPEVAAKLDRIDQLDEQVRAARERALAPGAPPQATTDLVALAAEAEAAQAALGAAAPAALVGLALRPVPLEEARAALGPDEALLVLSVGDLRGHTVLVTREGLRVWPVHRRADELDAMAGRLLAGLSLPRTLCPELAPFPARLAYELYRNWVAPAHEALRAQGISRVTVVPDSGFDRVPLDVLLTAPPARDEFGTAARDRTWFTEAPWLAREWETTIAPGVAAALLARRHALRAPAGGGAFVVADPAFAGGAGVPMAARSDCLDEALAGAPAAPPRLSELARLPQLRGLIPRFGEGPGARSASDLEADEGLLWRERAAVASARLVVFGTHGLAGPEDLVGLDQPAIALAPGGTAADLPRGAVLDGLLKADEVALLRFDADLVVLAACRSAAADARSEETVLTGLARAFFVAGARRVLVSLWPAFEGPTATLIPAVAALGPRLGYAAVLREARLRLIGDLRTAHPAGWAAFSLVGAP